MKRFYAFLKKRSDEKGQGLIEYALILVLVAVVVIAILLMLGPVVGNTFSNIVVHLDPRANAISGSGPGPGGSVITGVVPSRINPSLVSLTISVSTPTNVTVSPVSGDWGGSCQGGSCTSSCSGSCSITLVSADASGTVQVTASAGGSQTVSYN